jgi:hypothetical protein
MSGKSMIINGSQPIIINSFEATDNGEYIWFSIARTADNGTSTGAIIGLFGKPGTVSITDGDSNVTFTLSNAQISNYKYFTQDASPALEYFKINGTSPTVK